MRKLLSLLMALVLLAGVLLGCAQPRKPLIRTTEVVNAACRDAQPAQSVSHVKRIGGPDCIDVHAMGRPCCCQHWTPGIVRRLVRLQRLIVVHGVREVQDPYMGD